VPLRPLRRHAFVGAWSVRTNLHRARYRSLRIYGLRPLTSWPVGVHILRVAVRVFYFGEPIHAGAVRRSAMQRIRCASCRALGSEAVICAASFMPACTAALS